MEEYLQAAMLQCSPTSSPKKNPTNITNIQSPFKHKDEQTNFQYKAQGARSKKSIYIDDDPKKENSVFNNDNNKCNEQNGVTETKAEKKKKKSKKTIYYDDSDEESDVFVQKMNNKTSKQDKTMETFQDDYGSKQFLVNLNPLERSAIKRQELSPDGPECGNLVSIHKKAKISSPAVDLSDSLKEALQRNFDSINNSCCGGDKPSNLEDTKMKIPRLPRIFFGTRTHKQLEQVVKELRSTSYTKGLKMSILSSREHSCVRNMPSSYKSKTEFCKALMDKSKRNTSRNQDTTDYMVQDTAGTGCRYFDNKNALLGSRAPQDVWDIEEIVQLGQRRRACPYFAARDLADYANIIFCPYNYILDPLIRSSIQMSLDGDIVLIDEGHNIEDVCRETASLNIELTSIELSLSEIDQLIKAPVMSDNDTNDTFLYLKKYFENWRDWFENHKPLLRKQYDSESIFMMSGQDLADSLDRHGIGHPQFKDLVVRVNQVLADLKENKRDEPQEKRLIPGAVGVLLESICVVLDFLFRNDCKNLDDYKGLLSKKTDFGNQTSQVFGWVRKGGTTKTTEEMGIKMTLKICCMNSALVFNGVSKVARCVILTSGTLTPVQSFPAELGTKFPLTLQAPHVITPNQVWVGSVNSGPNGIPLEATFKNTSRTDWQDALGDLLYWICQNVPHGVLCFLSSYRLMEILQERWQSTGLWNKLEDMKRIFVESKRMTEHDQIMTDYYSCVGEDGALLLAVFRGKVSEGMDFRDHQARAVVTVGIPYPNIRDMMVEGKMKYNETHKEDRSLVSGRDWLQIQAYRALNQALGRCIRHRNDWGAVIMVDSRFKHTSYTTHISKWVRNFLGNKHHSWDSLTRGPYSLSNFMNNMKLTQPDTTKDISQINIHENIL